MSIRSTTTPLTKCSFNITMQSETKAKLKIFYTPFNDIFIVIVYNSFFHNIETIYPINIPLEDINKNKRNNP